MQIFDSVRNIGHRQVSLGSISAAKACRSYRQQERGGASVVTRTMALQVAKRAAAALGLKSTKIALIDQLFAFSKARDWTDEGVSPVVWPSNETLARRLGICISTMKHHLRGLVEAGLIGYSDHPTYQRKGVRDGDDRIVQAYGIDLSPLATRYDELRELAEFAEHEARRRQRLSYQRTSLRRDIESLIFAARQSLGHLDETWQAIQARCDQLREQPLPDNDDRAANVAAFEALRDEAEEAFEHLFDSRNFNSALSKSRPLQTTADLPDSDPCKDERNCADAQSVAFLSASGARALEEEPVGKRVRPQADANGVRTATHDDMVNISLPLIRAACPELAGWVPGALDHWTTLRRSGHTLCSLVSINPQVYREAQDILGLDLAIVALALTVERTARGEITNPGGYLRTLTQRGHEGSLHLSRSLFALAAHASPQPRR